MHETLDFRAFLNNLHTISLENRFMLFMFAVIGFCAHQNNEYIIYQIHT